MKTELKNFDLKNLVAAYRNGDIKIDREYQRGLKWSLPQQQALIDSLLRGYTLPLFYLHEREYTDSIGLSKKTNYYIVDGQQRLHAMKEFLENAFPLGDPSKAKLGSVVPIDPTDSRPWFGKKYNEMDDAQKEMLNNSKLFVVIIKNDGSNTIDEVRDLFIRLQVGTPLNAQEKRDAWPGDFTNFVIRHAGKPGHPESKPSEFLSLLKKTRKASTNSTEERPEFISDGNVDVRKFFAGLAMTIMLRVEGRDFIDITPKTIDSFYMKKSKIDEKSESALRVLRTLKAIDDLPQRKRLVGISSSFAFHLALLVDSLVHDSYVNVRLASPFSTGYFGGYHGGDD